jgi:hypothetical protein
MFKLITASASVVAQQTMAFEEFYEPVLHHRRKLLNYNSSP